MDLLLERTEVLNKFFENINTAFDLQVIQSLGSLKGTPHDSFELVSEV